jgi:ribosomal protein S18 acetylase RimI-like enzyme
MLSHSPLAFDADYDVARNLNDAGWRDWIGTGSSDQERAVWVAEKAGVPVGTVAAGVVATECHIGALWVEPGHRGAGIGGLLLDAAETWGHDSRCRWNALSVSEDNAAAQRLYLRRGYEFTGADKPTRWGHRELHMRKPAGR